MNSTLHKVVCTKVHTTLQELDKWVRQPAELCWLHAWCTRRNSKLRKLRSFLLRPLPLRIYTAVQRGEKIKRSLWNESGTCTILMLRHAMMSTSLLLSRLTFAIVRIKKIRQFCPSCQRKGPLAGHWKTLVCCSWLGQRKANASPVNVSSPIVPVAATFFLSFAKLLFVLGQVPASGVVVGWRGTFITWSEIRCNITPESWDPSMNDSSQTMTCWLLTSWKRVVRPRQEESNLSALAPYGSESKEVRGS